MTAQERALLVNGYLSRREVFLADIVHAAPFNSKRYNAALDELEEVQELLGKQDDE